MNDQFGVVHTVEYLDNRVTLLPTRLAASYHGSCPAARSSSANLFIVSKRNLVDLGEIPPLVAVAVSVLVLNRPQRDLRIVLAPTWRFLQELLLRSHDESDDSSRRRPKQVAGSNINRQRRGRDSNPRTRSTPVTRFPVAPVQPLRHLSNIVRDARRLPKATDRGWSGRADRGAGWHSRRPRCAPGEASEAHHDASGW